jgi:regulator of protease activity HflC (stomatin/prohibitin superfamily)
MIREKEAGAMSGGLMVVVLFIMLIASFSGVVHGVQISSLALVLSSVFLFLLTGLGLAGLFVVSPGEARVLQLFGSYVGTAKTPGLWWSNPFNSPRRRVSLRVRNFESSKLKVNDHSGNPIEIAAVVVWQVVDTAEAMFQVDDYNNFVKVQTESALRNLATSYPYDAHAEGEIALRSSTGEVADQLKKEIQERLSRAGVQVIESRISHLAYAPEIASAMLQRQQASAIVAARSIIVDGAVGMVEMALDKLSEKHVVTLDEERKAAMVSNLLVVLCSDRHTQPVVNAGTLYGG